jgi:NAD kinase
MVLLTPVNPKPLTVRPIILPADYKITISSQGTEGKFVKMVVDGRRELRIFPEHRIEITRHATSTLSLRVVGSSFFISIRNKLGWSGSHQVMD